jgi:hypothetical protein
MESARTQESDVTDPSTVVIAPLVPAGIPLGGEGKGEWQEQEQDANGAHGDLSG